MNRKQRRALGKLRANETQISVMYTGTRHGAPKHFLTHAKREHLDALEQNWLGYVAHCRAHCPEEGYGDDGADNAQQFVFSLLLKPEHHSNDEFAYLAAGALIWLARSKNYGGAHINFIISDDVDTPGNIAFALCEFSEPEVAEIMRKLQRQGKVTSYVDETGERMWRAVKDPEQLH